MLTAREALMTRGSGQVHEPAARATPLCSRPSLRVGQAQASVAAPRSVARCSCYLRTREQKPRWGALGIGSHTIGSGGSSPIAFNSFRCERAYGAHLE